MGDDWTEKDEARYQRMLARKLAKVWDAIEDYTMNTVEDTNPDCSCFRCQLGVLHGWRRIAEEEGEPPHVDAPP